MKTIVIIPSRLSATRLPGKPLLKINGLSIISHVFKKAEEANIGEVIVATEDKEIMEDVKKNGGQAILTENKHKTGTDRIFEAVEKIKDIENIKYVINLQGDEPQISTEDIINLDKNVRKLNSKIGTLCTDIKDKKIFSNSNIVKVSVNETFRKNNYSPALTFFRNAEDFDAKITYHHIGIYQYEISTLKKFINLKQTENEKKFRLEQLRALDNGIPIDVMYTQNSPIGVDTMDDFMEIKKIMEYKKD